MALRLITPVILSGGSGTRLWPASRDHSPKQFVSLFPGGSLFQATLKRCLALGLGKPIIVSSIHHANYVSAQIETGSAAAILYEPVARNTAPAIIAAALTARAQDPDALLLVLPSDHLINDEAAFKSCVVRAAA